MDYWKGPHSGIIANTPGLYEYRQIHLAENNSGMWPSAAGVDTTIPVERKIDGLAEVTFESALSPLAGRKQTALAFDDEVNVFRRSLLYAGPPTSSRWYRVGEPDTPVGSRALVYLRRRSSANPIAFHGFVKKELVPALAAAGGLSELRTQTFLPWSEKLWDTPNVSHDNPPEEHFHASVILGFETSTRRDQFFAGKEIGTVTSLLKPAVSTVHAYDVEQTLTFVKDAHLLPQFET